MNAIRSTTISLYELPYTAQDHNLGAANTPMTVHTRYLWLSVYTRNSNRLNESNNVRVKSWSDMELPLPLMNTWGTRGYVTTVIS